MQCPKCKNNGSRVVDSRPADDGRSIRRRRECEECGYRFTTFERLEKAPLLVIKRNGNREEFSREKLLNGLVRSAEKYSFCECVSSIYRPQNVLNRIRKNVYDYGQPRKIGRNYKNALKRVSVGTV